MTRTEIIDLMARAIHAAEYTDSFDDLTRFTQLNLRIRAEGALDALEHAGLIEVTA